MQIQAQVTETVEQVQIVQEVKKQTATITLEVDQDFVDLINFFGGVRRSEIVALSKNPRVYQTMTRLWDFVEHNEELNKILKRGFCENFTFKQQQ